MSIVYGIFSSLEWVIYNICSILFNVIFRLSYFKLFDGLDIVRDITSRVYLVLGILMVFRLVMSGVQYIVNPDTFDDKEKGMAGLLKNAMITVLLIALVPAVFDLAIDVQKSVVEEIPRIILGGEGELEEKDKSAGTSVAFTVLTSFVRPVNDKNSYVRGVNCYNADDENKTGIACPIDTDNNPVISDLESFHKRIGSGVDILGDGNKKYNYMYIISTIAGLFLGYMLLKMCLDIAIRTFKLNIIQMLSPIPISSYMFKKDNFNKFVKTSAQVYADLFIRMIIVYVVILVMRYIPGVVSNLFSNGEVDTSLINQNVGFLDFLERSLTTIALVFGLLMFASKAPKFITDLLGLPDVGSGDLKDMFKPAWQSVGGLSGVTSAINAYRSARQYEEDPKKALRRAASAGIHGVAERLKNVVLGKDFAESYATSRDAAFKRIVKK